MNECDGVDVHSIASEIADAVGAKNRMHYFGRGKQFRSDITEALKRV